VERPEKSVVFYLQDCQCSLVFLHLKLGCQSYKHIGVIIRNIIKTIVSKKICLRIVTLNLLTLEVIVTDVKAGCCLGSEGNGVCAGEEGEGGSGPPERGKDKQSMPNKGRDNMGKEEEDQPSQT
jgi:hypothetical protein